MTEATFTSPRLERPHEAPLAGVCLALARTTGTDVVLWRVLFVVLTVVLAASLFGMLGPLSRYAYDAGMVPLSFVAWRAAIGFLAAAAFIAWRARRGIEPLTRFGRLDRGERLTLLVAALLGFALNLAMFISFDLITIALALLGFYTYPVIVAVVAGGVPVTVVGARRACLRNCLRREAGLSNGLQGSRNGIDRAVDPRPF